MRLDSHRILSGVKEIGNKALPRFFDKQLIMFLLDRDRRMCKLNKAAVAMCRRTEEESIGLRGGEALRCVNAFGDPRGCGFSSACKLCHIKKLGFNYYIFLN